MAKGGCESEELFSSEGEDDRPTKTLTYDEYIKLLANGNPPQRTKVVLQTSDSSDIEQDVQPSHRKRRRHSPVLGAATPKPLTARSVNFMLRWSSEKTERRQCSGKGELAQS